jgi:hypothetical protein
VEDVEREEFYQAVLLGGSDGCGDGVESEIALARNRERLRRGMGYSSLTLKRLFF